MVTCSCPHPLLCHSSSNAIFSISLCSANLAAWGNHPPPISEPGGLLPLQLEDQTCLLVALHFSVRGKNFLLVLDQVWPFNPFLPPASWETYHHPHWQMRLLELLKRPSMVFPDTAILHEDKSQYGSGSSSDCQVETTAFAKLNLRLIDRFDLVR